MGTRDFLLEIGMETELMNTLIPKDKGKAQKKTKRPLEEFHFSTRQRAAFAYEHAWRRLPRTHQCLMLTTLLLILIGNFCKLVSAIALKRAVDTLSESQPVLYLLVAFCGLQ